MTQPVDAFAEAAPTYDAAEATNPIKADLRARSVRALLRAFPEPCRLLDVGAGTGAESLVLAKRGYEVVAVDPSAPMLAELSCKAGAKGVSVDAHVLPASRLAGLADQYAPFDGAYSSFGALNLEADLQAAVQGLARLVRPGGSLVLSVLNRWALVEALANLALLRPRRAARRWSGQALFYAPGGAVASVRYDTVGSLRRALRPWFKVERVEALGFAVPPPSAWPHLRKRQRLLRTLSRIDDRLSHTWPARRLGDQLLVMAVRV